MDHDHAHHDHAPPAATAAETLTTTGATLLSSTLAAAVLPVSAVEHVHPAHNHHEHQMKMFFHGGCSEIILFDFWQIDSFFGLFCSFIFIFLMGALYEGIKWFRIYFQLWTSDSNKSSACMSMNSVAKEKSNQGLEEALIEKAGTTASSCCATENSNNTLTGHEVYAPTVVVSTPAGTGMPINRWTWMMMYVNRECSPATCRLIETGIYAIQLLLAYWLMLIAMTFNTWLTAAVVFGAAFGHWMFANIKCAPPRRCFCQSCCNGYGGTENTDNIAADHCH